MNDEFLTCIMDQGVFWTPEGKFPSEYIGWKLRTEICTIEIDWESSSVKNLKNG